MIKNNDYERGRDILSNCGFLQAELKFKEGQQGSCPGLDFLFFSVAHRSPHKAPQRPAVLGPGLQGSQGSGSSSSSRLSQYFEKFDVKESSYHLLISAPGTCTCVMTASPESQVSCEAQPGWVVHHCLSSGDGRLFSRLCYGILLASHITAFLRSSVLLGQLSYCLSKP